MRRIAVVGTTGSGKTTLAREIAGRLGIPHVELDALNWGPNWTEASREVFRQRVADALAGEAWVVDGNYSAARDLIWPRADTVVWIDYPLWLILWRLLLRTFQRTLTGEELWSGNRERFRDQFFSRNSLFVWALQTYRTRRRNYPRLLSQPEHAHLKLVRLRSRRATEVWLSSMAEGHERGAEGGESNGAPGGT
ncbi:MAG: AAA family ATPase [bacterium]